MSLSPALVGVLADQLLSAEQVAQIFGVSILSLVNGRRGRGAFRHLPYALIARRVRYRRSDVERYINDCFATPAIPTEEP